jgi:dTDP-4-dehydrorhamnose reductase
VRLLVTGAAGLLGAAAVLDHRDEHQVVALSRRRPVRAPGVQSELLDLTTDALEEAWGRLAPDLVLHTAAMASIEACEQHPELAHRVNVDATRTLARLCAASGARLVHVSTDAVFDGTAGPYREDDVPDPRSVYARTKLESEEVCLQEDPDALVARVNFFGWSVSGTRSLAEFFLGGLRAGREVPGFSDVEFASLYNRDLAALLVDAGRRGLGGIVHVASADRMTKLEFGRAVARTFGLDPELVRPARLADRTGGAPRSPRLSLDPSAFAEAMGRPMPTFGEGLRRMRQDEGAYSATVRGLEEGQGDGLLDR